MPTPVRVSMTVLLAALVSAIAASAASPAAPPAGQTGAKSARAGVYSSDQALRGRKVFREKCAACHPTEFFTDGVFLGTWSGQTAHALFTVIRTTMPQETPGSLRRQEYADVLAYLLQLNKLPAGKVELAPTDDALKKVTIESPTKK